MFRRLNDQSSCVDPLPPMGVNANKTEPCVGPKQGETFLKVYNCDFIRPPKPERFARAMKQIYRPDHVYSHFVHYSTVTADIAQTYQDFIQQQQGQHHHRPFMPFVHDSKWIQQSPEIFVDELTQGALIHARSVLPHETRRKTAECFVGSKWNCIVGYPCEDSVPFLDEVHKENKFQNPNGTFCNCWKNSLVDTILVPQLEKRLRKGK